MVVFVAQDTVGQGCKNQCGHMFCSALSVPPLPACLGHTADSTACSYHTRPPGGQRLQALWLSGPELPPGGGAAGSGGVLFRTRPSDLPSFPTDCQDPAMQTFVLSPDSCLSTTLQSLFPFLSPSHSAPLLVPAVFSTALFWGRGGCAYSSSGICPALEACSLDLCPALEACSLDHGLPSASLIHGEMEGVHPVLFSDCSLACSLETGSLPDTGARVFQPGWQPASPRDLPLLCGVTGSHSNCVQLI